MGAFDCWKEELVNTRLGMDILGKSCWFWLSSGWKEGSERKKAARERDGFEIDCVLKDKPRRVEGGKVDLLFLGQ